MPDRRQFLAGLLAAPLAGFARPATRGQALGPARADPEIDLARIYGKIQFVDSFPDYKVQVVDSFPDLRVQMVDSFADSPGEWQAVDSFPDFKIQLVSSFPDFKIKFVTSFPGVEG